MKGKEAEETSSSSWLLSWNATNKKIIFLSLDFNQEFTADQVLALQTKLSGMCEFMTVIVNRRSISLSPKDVRSGNWDAIGSEVEKKIKETIPLVTFKNNIHGMSAKEFVGNSKRS